METINVIPEHFEAKQDNFPFKSPFRLSSAERDWCRDDNAKIVYIKRRHLEENLKTMTDIGMDESERTKFLAYWCSPNGSEIRAEGDRYFDLRQRAESWMENARNPKQRQQQPSRLEQYAQSARQASLGTQTIPAADAQPQGFGYANLPDEQ